MGQPVRPFQTPNDGFPYPFYTTTSEIPTLQLVALKSTPFGRSIRV